MRPASGPGQFTNGCIVRNACHIAGMSKDTKEPPEVPPAAPTPAEPPAGTLPKEIGGAPGPEPTRYGDWAHKGRVSDF